MDILGRTGWRDRHTHAHTQTDRQAFGQVIPNRLRRERCTQLALADLKMMMTRPTDTERQ